MSYQPQKSDSRWWLESGPELARRLAARMTRIRTQQGLRRDMYRFYAQLWMGTDNVDALSVTGALDSNVAIFVPPSMPFNVTRNAVETMVARIGKERPLPQVIPDDGDWNLERRARRMTQAIEGAFQYTKVFEKTPRALRHAGVFGTGVVRPWHLGDEPFLDIVYPWELRVDRSEARYGSPRSIYYETWVDKGVLIDRAKAWGCSKDVLTQIDEARAVSDEYGEPLYDSDDWYDRALVTSAWHLRSGKKAKDGVYAMALAGASGGERTLILKEPWERDYFPFPMMHYKHPLVDFWGEGIAQEMSGYQVEINMVAERVRAGHYLAGTGVWVVPENAGMLETDFTNSVAPIIFHKAGMAPQHVNPNPVSPQTMQWLMQLRELAPQDAGLNEMAMSGQKPPGIIAAKALQSIRDETSERMAMPAKAYDDFHVAIAEQFVDIFADIAEEHGDFSLRTANNVGRKVFVWRDVSIPRDRMQLSTQAASALAKTPGARIQQVYDLFNAKVISRVLFLKLLNSPDVSAETDLESAPAMLVDEQLESMLEADIQSEDDASDAFQQPLPILDLTYAMHRALCTWAFAKLRGAPEENLDLLLDYLDECRRLLGVANGVSDAGPPLDRANPAPLPSPPNDPGAQPGLPPSAPPAPGAMPS